MDMDKLEATLVAIQKETTERNILEHANEALKILRDGQKYYRYLLGCAATCQAM